MKDPKPAGKIVTILNAGLGKDDKLFYENVNNIKAMIKQQEKDAKKKAKKSKAKKSAKQKCKVCRAL